MAHLGRLLSLNGDCYKTYLNTELGYEDEGKGPDDTTVKNTGFVKRRSLFVAEEGMAPKVPLLGVLSHDLSSVKSLIIPNVDLKIKLYKNSAKVSRGPRSRTPDKYICTHKAKHSDVPCFISEISHVQQI